MGKVIYMSLKCSVDGCDNPLKSRGLCNVHYMRFRKSGELSNHGQPMKERGIKRDHPHYFRWSKLQTGGKLAPEWADFWRFSADIGAPSGTGKKLQRPDRTRPFGPGNFQWADKLVGERKNAYYRNWYKTGRKGRDGRYRKAYGIGLDEYEAISAAQEGLCALCKTSGNAKKLAVDHDHATGAVRGLLCQDCNTALGLLKDDAALLFAAIQYLGRFKSIGKVS